MFYQEQKSVRTDDVADQTIPKVDRGRVNSSRGDIRGIPHLLHRCFFYALPKYGSIDVGDTRAEVDRRKGLLFVGEAGESFMGGYATVSPFRELIADEDNVIVGYWLFFAGFTVIYSEEGKVLAKIDNGLDG